MGELPSGTVTFLFTDIEGSARLWEERAEGMASALARHDALLRRAIAGQGGVAFSTGGDGLAALFRAGHKIRVALGGHDAACFDRYGPPGETFTVQLGENSTLDLPVLT